MLLRLYNEIIPLQDGSKARLDREKNGATANAQNTASLGVDGEKDDAPDRGIDLQAILDATSEEEVIPVTDDET